MKLDPVLTQLDASIEAQLRMADPAIAEAAAACWAFARRSDDDAGVVRRRAEQRPAG